MSSLLAIGSLVVVLHPTDKMLFFRCKNEGKILEYWNSRYHVEYGHCRTDEKQNEWLRSDDVQEIRK